MLKAGDPVTVYGQWPGVVKEWRPVASIVQYQKHGSNLVGFVNNSRLRPRKEKRK